MAPRPTPRPRTFDTPARRAAIEELRPRLRPVPIDPRLRPAGSAVRIIPTPPKGDTPPYDHEQDPA